MDLLTDINLNRSALLLIEFQKTYTERGIFHWIVKKGLDSQNVIANAITLTRAARANGIKVIHAPLILDKHDKKYKNTPFIARLFKRFTKDTWKCEFTDGTYEKSDIVVNGRYDFDATVGSNLILILEENKINTVFVGGFTTDHCVKETMTSLQDKGYQCIMVSDLTATRNKKLQKKMESYFHTTSTMQLIKKMS